MARAVGEVAVFAWRAFVEAHEKVPGRDCWLSGLVHSALLSDEGVHEAVSEFEVCRCFLRFRFTVLPRGWRVIADRLWSF